MSERSEINAKIINELSSVSRSEGDSRFILYGSIARGVLLGDDVLDLTDARSHRFQDVDCIDKEVVLTRQYSFMNGTLDMQVAKVTHPLPDDPDVWGFFDSNAPIHDRQPISTYNASELSLDNFSFSREYPDSTIEVPGAIAMIALSNFFAYSYEMPKHKDQINRLIEIAPEYKESEIWAARDKYIFTMGSRYSLNAYGKARKKIFDIAPSLALGIQKGRLGSLIRSVRSTTAPDDLPLSIPEVRRSSRI